MENGGRRTLGGQRFFQKMLWFTCPGRLGASVRHRVLSYKGNHLSLHAPPPLNLMAGCRAIILATSPFCSASAYCCIAALKFVTYAWWCFWWWTYGRGGMEGIHVVSTRNLSESHDGR